MDLDFEGMYANSKEKKSKSEVLELIQICSASLEFAVSNIVKNYIKKIDSKQDIKKIPTFKKKIDYLKNKRIIDDLLHNQLLILSNIRNKLFHDMFTDKLIFNLLENIKISNHFVDNLKSDSKRYELIHSYCWGQLFEIADKIAPEETMHLQMIPDTTFEPTKDPFS